MSPVLLQLHKLAIFKKPSFYKLFLFFLFPICFIPIITSWENGIQVPKSQISERFSIIIIFSQAMRLVEVSSCLRLGQVSQGYLAQRARGPDKRLKVQLEFLSNTGYVESETGGLQFMSIRGEWEER